MEGVKKKSLWEVEISKNSGLLQNTLFSAMKVVKPPFHHVDF